MRELAEVAEGSLLSARGSPWQRHILGGFCGFLRQPVLLGTLQVQVIWVGKPSPHTHT